MGHGGGWQGSDHEHIHAHRDQSAGERGFEHVAGDAGVLADEHAVAVRAGRAQHVGDRLAHAQGHFGGDWEFIDPAANAVGSEEFHGGVGEGLGDGNLFNLF